MSESDINKKVVRDLIDVVWMQGRLDALPQFWTEDCINHADSSQQNSGLAALRRYHAQFAEFFGSFSNVRIEIDQQIGEGDRVVTQVTAHLTHTAPFNGLAATGRTVELKTIRIDRFVGGKIVEHWSVADMAGLMHQLQG